MYYEVHKPLMVTTNRPGSLAQGNRDNSREGTHSHQNQFLVPGCHVNLIVDSYYVSGLNVFWKIPLKAQCKETVISSTSLNPEGWDPTKKSQLVVWWDVWGEFFYAMDFCLILMTFSNIFCAYLCSKPFFLFQVKWNTWYYDGSIPTFTWY